ncbi:MAG: hypothetical protein ABL930_12480, partial [Pseudobdellovibrio sp.]
MHSEPSKNKITLKRFEFIWLGLGLYCVVMAMILAGVCFTKTNFLGLEKYYENYWFVIYGLHKSQTNNFHSISLNLK